MSATRKFLNLSAWAIDAGSDPEGPVEAEAFLVALLERVGPMMETKVRPKPKNGAQHQRAGACFALDRPLTTIVH